MNVLYFKKNNFRALLLRLWKEIICINITGNSLLKLLEVI